MESHDLRLTLAFSVHRTCQQSRMTAVEMRALRSNGICSMPQKDPFPNPSHAAEQTRLDHFHLAATVDLSDDPIISHDLNGIIITWNQAAARLYGYEADEIVGQSILRLTPPELHEEEVQILRKLQAEERIDHYETVQLRKNGETLSISFTVSPVINETGRVIGAAKAARDMSDRRRNDEIHSGCLRSSTLQMTPLSAKT